MKAQTIKVEAAVDKAHSCGITQIVKGDFKVKLENISAIILAAGYSSRMGDYKPLLKLGSYFAIEHTVRCFLQAGVLDVRVVVGFRAEELVEVVEHLGGKVVVNPEFAQGMYSSIQAGVRSLEQNAQAFFILPSDIPLISSTTIKRIVDCYLQFQHSVIRPVYNGQWGHPPLISARFKEEITQRAYQDGLRGFLHLHEQETYEMAVQDEAVLLDMDTPEDYRALVNYHNRNNKPSVKECWRILCETGVEKKIKGHSWMVAFVAYRLVTCLNEVVVELDEDLILAGALLHDISRSELDHAQVGAKLLEAWGYPLVAAVVNVHMDIEVLEDQPLTEAEVVYLADKMVRGSTIVSIQERFSKVLERYKGDPQTRNSVLKRLHQVELIIRKVEKKLGCKVDLILAV